MLKLSFLGQMLMGLFLQNQSKVSEHYVILKLNCLYLMQWESPSMRESTTSSVRCAALFDRNDLTISRVRSVLGQLCNGGRRGWATSAASLSPPISSSPIPRARSDIITVLFHCLQALPGADIILLCYNILSYSSFARLHATWLTELADHTRDTRIILVGLKEEQRSRGATVEVADGDQVRE